MITAGAGSRAASRSERQTQQVTRMRPIVANAVIAAAVASALAIAAPAFARSGLEVEDLLAPPVQLDQAGRATTLPDHRTPTFPAVIASTQARHQSSAAMADGKTRIAAAHRPDGPDMARRGAGMAEECRPD
jgi:hypothetical protein